MKKKKSVLLQTISVAVGTLLSRMTGFVRTVLFIRFLGAGVTADAFNAVFTMASTLRKIFAEGAISAALSPTLVTVMHNEGKRSADALLTLTLFCVQTVLIAICLLLSFNAQTVIAFAAPGFTGSKALLAIDLVRIMIFFIVFVSAAALLASALQSVHRFFVPAHAQVIMNLLFVVELCAGLYYGWTVYALAWFVLLNSFIVMLVHIGAYVKAGLTFVLPTQQTVESLKVVLKKFVPCMFTLGSIEISLFIDRMMASFLPTGSVSVLSYVWSFMGLPLGVVAGAFGTVLLPHMSRVGAYAPKRLSVYLFESVKLIMWVTVPLALLLGFFAYPIFSTLFADKLAAYWIVKAAQLLMIFSAGLFFFSINRILLNFNYALHDTFKPTVVSLGCTVLNTILNIILMRSYGVLGIACATAFSEMLKTGLLLAILARFHRITFYVKQWGAFFARVLVQLTVLGLPLYICYRAAAYMIALFPHAYAHFFLEKIGFWFWVGPLCLAFFGLMYVTRKRFGLRLYFLS